jgi:hypothetical protein
MANTNKTSAKPQTSGLDGTLDDWALDDKSGVEVLLVGDGRQAFSLSQRHLEKKGCRCHVAKSQGGLKDLVNQKRFDIVLTMLRIEGSSTDWLGAALSGSRASLFYMLPVEVGCWWVPVLRTGVDCLGVPALRHGEFFDALNEIVDEIRAAAATIVP